MKQKKSPPFEAIMAAVIILLVLVMAADGFIRQKMPMDAAKYPIFVFSVVVISGIAEIVRAIRAQNKESGEVKENKTLFENRRNFLIITGMIIGYVIAMWLLGFIISTIVFAITFATCYKLKHLIIFDISAVAVTIGVYYCFSKLLYVFLPAGLLFDKLF